MTTLTAATPTMGGGMAMGTRMRPPMAAGGGPSLGGAEILRIIRQRLVMILLVWTLCIGATVGVTLLKLKYWPEYSAQALIKVDSVEPIDPLNMFKPDKMTEEEQERVVMNQTLILKSPDVLQEALKDASLRQTRWFSEAEKETERRSVSLVDLLDETISASPVRQSSFFTVRASWKFPTEVPILVNTVVDKFWYRIQENQKGEIRRASEQLKKETNQARSAYDDANNKVQDFRSSMEVLGQGTEPNERLMTLDAVVTELELDASGKQSFYEQLQNFKPEDMPLTIELQNLLASDPTLARMNADLQFAEENLRRARQKYGENHRVVKEARDGVDMARRQVDEETAIKTLRYNTQQLDQARNNYLQSQEMLLRAKDQYMKARAEQRDRDAKLATYYRLIEDRDMFRQRLEALSQQSDLVDIQLRNDRQLRIDVVSRAPEPRKISSPRLVLWLPAGAFLGLGFSVGLALLLDLMDKSVRTPRDISRQAAIPVLGTIPTSHDDEIEIVRVETASIDAPHSIIAEAFRQLRANLFFSAPAEQQGVLMVTSPSGGNGKTTVATNLAISIALSGRRVLLVDANFRRPALPKVFQQIRPEGLSNILIGQSRLAELVTATAVPGLDVLGTGPTPPNPSELLGSSYLRDLVVDARSRYDQVIFDGPPVLLVSDAMVLAGAVDGVLMVCQYRTTSRGALQRARSQLDAINSRIFGAVLNLVETRAGGYFRKQYKEFYEYHEQEGGAPTFDAGRVLDGAAVAAAGATAVAVAAPVTTDDKFEPEPADDPAAIKTEEEIARQIEAVGDVRLDDRLSLGDDLDQIEFESETRPVTDAGGPAETGVADEEIAGLGDNVELDPDFGLDDELGLGGEFQGDKDDLGWTDEPEDPRR